MAVWGWEEQPFPSKARHRLFGKEMGEYPTVKGMLREASCACSMGTILATTRLGTGAKVGSGCSQRLVVNLVKRQQL